MKGTIFPIDIGTIARRVAALPAVLALAACGLSDSGGMSVNLTDVAGLVDTQAIEIVELPEPGQAAEAPERVVAVIREPAEIQQIVAALETDLPLVPRALCLERYRLRFVQPDGQAVSFGYSCDGGGAFLRGDQAYWRGMDVQPPEDFQELLSTYLQD